MPTGTFAISATDPGPLVGTALQPGPNGALAFVVLADGELEVELSELLDPQAAIVITPAAARAGMTMSRVRVFMFPPEVSVEVLLRLLFAQGRALGCTFLKNSFLCDRRNAAPTVTTKPTCGYSGLVQKSILVVIKACAF